MAIDRHGPRRLKIEDPLHAHAVRGLAKNILYHTDPDDPQAADRVEFASRMLDRVREYEEDRQK